MELQIKEPCEESWNDMISEEKGNFCTTCEKTVIDFTNLSDKEIYLFFQKNTGKVCGKFNSDQLDRNLNEPISKNIFSLQKSFFSLMILLGLNHETEAQSLQKNAKPASSQKITKNKSLKNNLKEITVFGEVLDEKNGRKLPFVNIWVNAYNLGTITDENGEFRLKLNVKDWCAPIKITFNSIGYLKSEQQISTFDKPLNISMIPDSTNFFGVKGYAAIKCTSITGGVISVINKPLTIKSKFKNFFRRKN